MLQRCEEVNLALNWEKCHFMVRKGIVLGHLVSKCGIEVDRARVEVIETISLPNFIKGMLIFIGASLKTYSILLASN